MKDLSDHDVQHLVTNNIFFYKYDFLINVAICKPKLEYHRFDACKTNTGMSVSICSVILCMQKSCIVQKSCIEPITGPGIPTERQPIRCFRINSVTEQSRVPKP
jgi:hypothetical protein